MNSFKEMKRKAKDNLFNHYFLISFTCLMAAFIGVEFVGSIAFASGIDLEINTGTKGVLATIINLFTSNTIFNFLLKTISSVIGSRKIANIILTILAFLGTLSFWALVKNVYRVIARRVVLEARIYEKVPINRFTFLLRIRKWMKVSWTLLVYSFYYFLWSLTIVGYFIKRYEYFLVPFILAENPDLSAKEAISLSRKMMDGHKWEAFLLELSFIGYDILGVFTLGLTQVFFSNGYFLTTCTEYYAVLREDYIKSRGEGYEKLFDTYLYQKATNKLLKETYGDVYQLMEKEEEVKLPGFRGFLYSYFGINLYSEKKARKLEKSLLNQYKISYYSDMIMERVYPTRLYPMPEKKQKKHFESFNYMKSYSIYSLILMFFSFSMIGWLWEVLLHLISDGEFVNRGVLHGPWLPIYGSGALLIIILLKKFRSKPALEFSLIIFLCGMVEYFTAVYLEMRFGLSWWDYSGYFLNIHGRVCAEGLIVFGLGGMAGVYLLAPLFDRFFSKFNIKIAYGLCVILLGCFIFDKIYSGRYPNTGNGISSDKVNTKEVAYSDSNNVGASLYFS